MKEHTVSDSLGRMARLAALIVALFTLGEAAQAQTSFYVDANRTVNGTGTAASPWTNWSSISWTAVSNALPSGTVNIYFSSRCTVAYNGGFSPRANGLSSSQLIQFIGNAYYNTNTTGTAQWFPETNGNRVFFTGAVAGTNNAYNGGSIELYCGNYFLSFVGIHVTNSTYACFEINPSPGTIVTTNVHDIFLTNCCLDTPISQHGFYGGYLETNCYDFTISGCQISNSLAEPIYVGHYCYFPQTITNVVIESNLIVNCGIGSNAFHQGQINLKPGVFAAIVRYNTKIYTVTYMHGGSSGIECFGDYNQIYGNKFINEQQAYDGSWGYGIMLIADGDNGDSPKNAQGQLIMGPGEGNPLWTNGQGSAITSCLIYNNLIVNPANSGIVAFATTTNVPGGASISGIQIWNNTIWGAHANALNVSVTSPQTFNLTQFYNNIIGNSAGYDIYMPANGTTDQMLNADDNLYWHPGGTNWYYQRNYGVTSIAQWQSLGFDQHGTNANPMFIDPSNPNPFALNFNLAQGSPAAGMGVPAQFFANDLSENPRPPNNWELGPFQLMALAPPSNLRVISQ